MSDILHRIAALPEAPLWVWLLVGAQGSVIAALLIWANRRRSSDSTATTEASSVHRLAKGLLIAALTFCSVVMAAYIVGTYEGSTAFAHDQLGWVDWRRPIPWATLDAAGFGFGLLWIRAVVLERSPIRPRRVVYICAGFSAFLQMVQGGQNHYWQAGTFLAGIAVLGGLVLHTLVDQIRKANADTDEAEWHTSPPFKLRWFTFFPNTLCAALAWINHPPVKGTEPTVANAVIHLGEVRAAKRAAAARDLLAVQRFPRWTVLAPPIRSRLMLSAINSATASTAEQTGEQVAQARAEHTVAAERAHLLEAEASTLRAQVADLSEQVRRAHGEHTRNLLAEQTERARLAEELESARRELKRAEQRTGHAREQGKGSAPVAELHSDEQIADVLAKEYRAHLEQTGEQLSGYRVRKAGNCHQRQADRVLAILASRFPGAAEHTASTPGEHRARVDPSSTTDADEETTA